MSTIRRIDMRSEVAHRWLSKTDPELIGILKRIVSEAANTEEAKLCATLVEMALSHEIQCREEAENRENLSHSSIGVLEEEERDADANLPSPFRRAEIPALPVDTNGDFSRFPVRKSQKELGRCQICNVLIVKGQFYHDGGTPDRRAHQSCVPAKATY